jgi:hypothetical protein
MSPEVGTFELPPPSGRRGNSTLAAQPHDRTNDDGQCRDEQTPTERLHARSIPTGAILLPGGPGPARVEALGRPLARRRFVV